MRLKINLEKQKIFRSDNAKEYFSHDLSSFLSSKGILRQSTCPHTPQQNGIAERKNRHLLETTCSLMLNSNVPTHHWRDAVLTAWFLINRLPSSSLENQISHSIIFPHDPLFHVSPKVFGCTCFVHDLSPGLDKLSSFDFAFLCQWILHCMYVLCVAFVYIMLRYLW